MSESFQSRLAAALRRWEAGDHEPIDARHEIAGLLEWFLCAALRRSLNSRVSNSWSDGVTDAVLEPTDEKLFVTGLTFWTDSDARMWLAPFELEFYWSADRDGDFERSILRFGQVDSGGNIVLSDTRPKQMVFNRPTTNADWAVAIELT